jgi:hypothetical protein
LIRERTSSGRKASRGVGPDRIPFHLDFMYRRSGVVAPDVQVIAPEHIPFPYRTLLVHTNDMTLTLERHFGGPLVVQTLSTLTTGDWYFRRVLLAQEYFGTARGNGRHPLSRPIPDISSPRGTATIPRW